MAGRIRTIKPELREHAPFATLTDAAARLFVMLYTLVDDKGRCPADASFLAGAVFYGRPRPPSVVGRLVRELVKAELVATYTAERRQYLEIVGWLDKERVTHQRIDKPQPGRYPGPEKNDSRNVPRMVRERSETDLRPPTSDPDHRPEPLAPARARAIPPSTEPGTEPRTGNPDQDARRQLGDRAWERLNAKRTELAVSNGWHDVRPLHPMDPGRTELAARLQEAGDRAELDLEHVLAVAFAEADAKRTVEYLDGAMFRASAWAKKLAMRVADATHVRRGPRGSAIGAAAPRSDHPESEHPVDFGAVLGGTR